MVELSNYLFRINEIFDFLDAIGKDCLHLWSSGSFDFSIKSRIGSSQSYVKNNLPVIVVSKTKTSLILSASSLKILSSISLR